MFRNAIYRNKLEKHLSKNEEIIAAKLDDAQLSTLIEKAYEQALPLLQRQALGTLFFSNKPASNEDMVELLESYVLSNLKPNQATPKP